MKNKGKFTLDDLTKSNIWTVTETQLNQMLIEGKKHDDYNEMEKHYLNIIRTVFDIQYLNRDDENRMEQLSALHYEIFSSPNEGNNNAIAIRKKPIKKITDLTLENIFHLEPYEVLDLIKNNMGTGWKGLPLAIQDIIQASFFVDVSTLPEKIMHRAGGSIDRHKEDGYEVLELDRSGWIEAIFIKEKPKMEKPRLDYKDEKLSTDEDDIPEEPEDDEDEDLDLPDTDRMDDEEDDDETVGEDSLVLEDIDDIQDDEEDDEE